MCPCPRQDCILVVVFLQEVLVRSGADFRVLMSHLARQKRRSIYYLCSHKSRFLRFGAGQDDLERVKQAGNGRVDITVGSALDIFGGKLPYGEVLAWYKQQTTDPVRADLVTV